MEQREHHQLAWRTFLECFPGTNLSNVVEEDVNGKVNVISGKPKGGASDCADSRHLKLGVWGTPEEERLWFRILSNMHAESEAIFAKSSRCSGPNRIPQIVHHIWLGGQLPERFQIFVNTWKEKHPSWEFIFWDDSAVESFGLENARAYNQAENFGEKSDIARYEILNRFGGVYIDTDFECLGNFEALHQICDFYCGMSNTGCIELNNGLIGSAPEHPILKELIARIGHQLSVKEGTQRASSLLASMVIGVPLAGSASKSGIAGLDLVGAFLSPADSNVLGKMAGDAKNMETIEKTGPGLFTRTVMGFQRSTNCYQGSLCCCPTSEDICSCCERYEKQQKQRPLTNIEDHNNQATRPDVCGCGRILVLPPVYFYPIPNDNDKTNNNEDNETRAITLAEESLVLQCSSSNKIIVSGGVPKSRNYKSALLEDDETAVVTRDDSGFVSLVVAKGEKGEDINSQGHSMSATSSFLSPVSLAVHHWAKSWCL